MMNTYGYIASHQSIWKTITPWLNSYVQYVSKSGLERVVGPLELEENPKYRAINNEAAFILFENSSEDIETSIIKSKNRLKFLAKEATDSYVLDDKSEKIIFELYNRLKLKYSKFDDINPNFIINGNGMMNTMHADILIDDKLIEIKAGKRKISVSDIKQLLIYLSLNYKSKQYKINEIELFNPREGYCYNSSVEEIVYSIADMSSQELFESIINENSKIDKRMG